MKSIITIITFLLIIAVGVLTTESKPTALTVIARDGSCTLYYVNNNGTGVYWSVCKGNFQNSELSIH